MMVAGAGAFTPRLRVVAALLLIVPSVAFAQDFDRVVPKLPPPKETPEVAVPEQPALASQDQSVLIPELRGIVFVPGMGALQPGGVAPESVPGGVLVRDLPALSDPAFTSWAQGYLGRPLSQADLDAIGNYVREVYRTQERPFVEVTVPQQNVSNGIVQVVVTEYRIGDITVTGNKHFSTKLIRSFGDLESGETLTLPRMRKALGDYNQNPFLGVSAVMKPGNQTGLTDIELQATDRTPWRVYGGYDNQGSPTLDRDEWYVGFNWGNVLGSGDILSYQFTRSFNGRYESHSLSTVIPIDADNRVLLFGAYATQEPFIADFFRSKGHSSQVSFRWAKDLNSTGVRKDGLQFGFDFKNTNNNLEFAGFRLLDTEVEIYQFPVIFTAVMPDRLGETEAEVLFVFSPGGITDNNTDEAFQALVPFADATYAYSRISLTRTTNLPHEMSWIARGMVQIASGNLMYSEQLGGGGIGSVRGYDTNTALGSEGVLVSQEIRSPAFSLFGKGKDGAVNDQLQLGVFVDYAYLRQRERFPDSPRSAELLSVGAGIHYNIERYLDLQLEVGTQLKRSPGAEDKDTRAAIIATVSY
jgi:hemolysin activation/secretion protein